jgi:hypothetical protein
MEPPPVELQVPHVTEPLAAVIRCALAKEPADRFASASRRTITFSGLTSR